MARQPGPLDRGQHLSTAELLTAVDVHGKHWPAALADYCIEALSVAVGREITAHNLVDGATLSPQGRKVLAGLRIADADVAVAGGVR